MTNVNDGNIISAKRARAELKQFVSGARADGFGKYASKIFVISDRKRELTQLMRPEDVSIHIGRSPIFIICRNDQVITCNSPSTKLNKVKKKVV